MKSVSHIWKKLSFIFKREHKYPKLDLKELYNRLGYSFNDSTYVFQALKHRSFLAFSGEKRINSNERLELLGDSVLGLVVTDFLYKNHPDKEEGVLTSYKSLLVNGKFLAKIAKEFELGDFMLLSDSEERSGGRKRVSILADAMEAIIGAIYLDGGLKAAETFIEQNITCNLDELLQLGTHTNYKSMLQEHCQSHNICGPKYIIKKEEGPDHSKIFTISAILDSCTMGTGKGPSKKHAEQLAAKETLISLNLI